MLLSIDGTFLIQILNFAAFWILLNFLFIAPTRRAIEERQRLLAAQHREADELRAQSAAIRSQAAAILDEARRRTDELMREAAARASAETSAIEKSAAEEAGAIVALAHASVASERAQASAKQAAFVSELARSMSQRALGLEGVA
jgi:F0F1-type ATP synthase membrane subunit b/b'